jgi:hypothetical protein
MNYSNIAAAMAAEQARDHLRVADRSRLIAMARCCRPAAWKRAIRSIATAIASGPVGRHGRRAIAPTA